MDEDPALEAANLALTGRRRAERALASIELRAIDPNTGVWEVAAAACVGLATLLIVLGFWFY